MKSLIVICLLVLLLAVSTCLCSENARGRYSLKRDRSNRVAVKIGSEQFKQVQGPPEEFDMHHLPSPQEAAVTSHSATIPVFLQEQQGKTGDKDAKIWKWEGSLPVDVEQSGKDQVTITIVSNMVEKLDAKVQVPSSEKQERMNFLAQRVEKTWFGWANDASVPAKVYVFENAKAGTWNIEITSQIAPQAKSGEARQPEIFLILSCSSLEPRNKVFSHFGSPFANFQTNDKVSVLTRLFDDMQYQKELAIHQSEKPSSVMAHQQFNGTFDYLSLVKQTVKDVVHARNKPIPKAIVLNGVNHPQTNKPLYMMADLELTLPDGEERVITMHDKKQREQKPNLFQSSQYIPDDEEGVFGAEFTVDQEGPYTARVVVRGMNLEGQEFIRTSSHFFYVVENEQIKINDIAKAKIQKQSSQEVQEEDFVQFKIGIQFDQELSKSIVGHKFKPYAQVWGTNNGKVVPVAFISGMSIAEKDSSNDNVAQFSLSMSMKWLSRSGASFPLYLRDLYIQDVDTNIPLATLKEANVKMIELEDNDAFNKELETLGKEHSTIMVNALLKELIGRNKMNQFDGVFSEAMLQGKRPKNLTQKTSNSGKLLLVHGYCSETTPFETKYFTNHAVFLDAKQSRTNDEFALLVLDFSNQFDSFSTVSHSQGGLVTLHLYQYYWSGQDASSENKRLLQTVGTPFHGNTLAGDIASLGTVFGVGCGPCHDLTRSGAELWLSSITALSRSKMYYYTTQYKDWSWCNLAANAVLQWPNDGTAEYEYTSLEGGNNKGHTKSQCHSKNMKYTPQCTVESRDREMDEKASR